MTPAWRADPGSHAGGGVGRGSGPGGGPNRRSGPGGRPGPRTPRPVRIGITGPIGCGKSTVAGWLRELGARVIDADQVARVVTPPGSDALAAVVDAFGSEVLREDGTLDRAALGRIVFADPAALRRLEAIIHPAVRPRILELVAAAERDAVRAVVIEAIKLVEGGLAALCDEVWLVFCEPAAQRERLAARAAAAAPGPAAAPSDAAAAPDTEARIAAQGDLVARLTPHATRVIDTSGSIAESRSRVMAAWTAALDDAPS